MLKSLFPRSQFSKNIFALSAGAVGAQVLNFFLTIVLTRIYSPADFGLLTIYLSVASLITVIATGKYDVAIVVAKSREEGISLVRLSLFIVLVTSLLTLLTVYLLQPLIIARTNHPEAASWFYYLPLTVLFLSAVQVFWMWHVREKKFRDLSAVRIIESGSNGGFSILLQTLGAKGLMLGALVGQFLSTLYMGMRIVLRDKFNPFSFNKKELQEHARAYSDFPRYNILQGFADMFLLTGIVVVGANYFSAPVMGLYALCMRVLQVPMGLIVRPIAHVFFSEASEIYRRGGDIFPLTKQTALRTALFASVIPIVILIAGPFLFSFVFGEKWHEAGVYAQFLSLWIFLDLIKAPISQVAIITGRQKEVLRWTLLVSVILLLVIIGAGNYFGETPRKAMMLIAAYQSVHTVFFIFLLLKLARQKASA